MYALSAPENTQCPYCDATTTEPGFLIMEAELDSATCVDCWAAMDVVEGLREPEDAAEAKRAKRIKSKLP